MKMIRAVILVGAIGLLGCGQEKEEVASTAPVSTTNTTAPQSDFAADAYSDEAIVAVVAYRTQQDAWYTAVTEAEEARVAAEAAAAERAERREREQAQVVAAVASEPVIVDDPQPSGDIWWQLALCESGGNNVNTGNGYYGYFQFSASTWHSVGGSGLPSDHGYGEQVARAQQLQARSGWGQWPGCSRRLGLR